MGFNREINQLFNMFRRSWKSGAKATLNLSTENGVLKAALELELGKLNDAHPDVTAATSGLLDAGARPVRRHILNIFLGKFKLHFKKYIFQF